MIITITGKPCSGKGTVGKLFCKKFNFQYISTGDMFREASKKYSFDSITEFNKDERIKKIDAEIDNNTIKIGKTKLKEDIMIDSRLAWHFIPKSYKVFLDVKWQTAGERLITANREEEQVSDLKTSVKNLKTRWKLENSRYQELYSTDNLNKKNYNLVVKTDDKTAEQIVEIIYKNYKKFMQNA